MSAPVLIVGGGFAGASAALRLAKHGVSTVLLEARDRVGGRVYTQQVAGNPVDVGGSNIHGYQRSDNPARQLAEELGIACHIPKSGGPRVFFGGQPVAEGEVAAAQEKIDQLIDAKLAQAQAASGPESDVGLDSVIDSIRAVAPFAEGLARIPEIPTGLRLEQISAKYYKTENAMVGVDALAEGGYNNMVIKMLEKAKTDVKLSAVAKSIEETSSGVKVVTANGDTFKAPAVICTVPLALLKKGDVVFKPALPAPRLQQLERTAVGTLDKLALGYDAVWWTNNAAFLLLPSATPPANPSSPDEILASTSILAVNIATHPGNKPVLLLLIGPGGAELANHSEAAIAQAAHKLLVHSIAPAAEPALPKHFVYQSWSTDPYSLGATSSPIVKGRGAVPDDWTSLGEAVWDGKLGFAGEHTDRHLRGSVPGAIVSGYREGDRVAKMLGKN